MKTISNIPNNLDRYIVCLNYTSNGNLIVENTGRGFIESGLPKRVYRETFEDNHYNTVGIWKIKKRKMNNTIQRRLNRERIIKNILWFILSLLTAYFIFGCSSDDDCECFKETYSKEVEHLYDTPADPSKCKGDAALFNDDFGTMYRYQCK